MENVGIFLVVWNILRPFGDFVAFLTYFSPLHPGQGCQIFLDPNIPNGKNILNYHKLYQTAINFTKWP
jgi:hypothetical protein